MADRRHVNEDETPRGRLLRRGAQALSDAELLAILLRTSSTAASEVLATLGGMYRLPGIERGDLNGTSKARTAVLLAAVEFARRLARVKVPERVVLQRMPTVARYLQMRYDRPSQEVLGALYLDVRHRLIHEAEIFRGALSHATVEPRAVLRLGLAHHAARLILFHTHPSGEPLPSRQDNAFSRRMSKACQLVGIEMKDHIVLGVDGWFSFRAGRGGSFEKRTSSGGATKNPSEKVRKNHSEP